MSLICVALVDIHPSQQSVLNMVICLPPEDDTRRKLVPIISRLTIPKRA